MCEALLSSVGSAVISLHNREFIGGEPGLFILVLQQDGANCASWDLGTDGPIMCISVD
jgi:hypothetical protein